MQPDSHLQNESSVSASDNDDAVLIGLVRTLENAYGNAIRHDTANPDSEAMDLLLENASIRLSSRISQAISTGACPSNEPKPAGTAACLLDDESVGLKNLTDMLSYAASELQRVGRSGGGIRHGIEIPGRARARSMEHLYRMTFAIAKAYLDRSQSRAYLEAAREELRLAREHIQREESLGASRSGEYGVRLLELSELDDGLSSMVADRIRR